MFNIKKSLLCISAISCISLYAAPIEVTNPITIGSTPSVPTETDYNYWKNNNTYVFNSNRGKHEIAKNTVTIDEDYTLKLLTDYTDRNYFVLDCYNTFTNNGNVIIDKYGTLRLDKNYHDKNYPSTSTNNGTIGIINGYLILDNIAILNNTETITFEDSSYIYINNSTVTNTGTIDISNITNISYWYNYGKFTLEGGSTFILPKSITDKIKTFWGNNPITLNGTKDKPVNIVIPKDCEYIKNIDNNNKEELFELIKEVTGLIFNGNNRDYVEFSWQKK